MLSNSISRKYSDLCSTLLRNFGICDVAHGLKISKDIANIISEHKLSLDDSGVLLFLEWAVQNYEEINDSGNFQLVDQLLLKLIGIKSKVFFSDSTLSSSLQKKTFSWYFKNPLNSSLDKICTDYVRHLLSKSLSEKLSKTIALLPKFSIEIKKELDKLGEGRFANVESYSCIRDGKEENIAIKRYKPGTNHPNDFLREQWFCSLLSPHEYIIDYYGFGIIKEKGRLTGKALALKLVDFTLSDLLFAEQPHSCLYGTKITFSDVQRIRFLIQIASAVVYMHALNIVHCNLKLTNILMKQCGEQWTAHLTGFDMSAFDGDQIRVDGTPAYMAPEMFEASSIYCSTAIDAYAFAIMMCAVMSLEEPWHHKERQDFEIISNAVRTGERPKTNKLSLFMQAIVHSAWGKNPQRRMPLSLCSVSLQEEQDRVENKSNNFGVNIFASDFIGAMDIMYNLSATINEDQNSWLAISKHLDALSLLTWACQHLEELKIKREDFDCVDKVLGELLKNQKVAQEILSIKNGALLKQWCLDNAYPSCFKERFIELIKEEVKEKIKDSSCDKSIDDIQSVLVGLLPNFDIKKMKKREALGEGNFSNVVRCDVRQDNKMLQVALKIYNEDQKPRYTLREMFFHHMARHENIVNFLGLYTETITSTSTCKILGIVLELANYQLCELMMTKDALIQQEVTRLGLLVDIASALDYVHGQGIVHRDIKPENILIFITKNSLTAKLTDFGVSAYCGAHVPSAGTIGYDPPEYVDAAGELFPCSDKADVYSFGIFTVAVMRMQSPWPDLAAIPDAEWSTRARDLREEHHLNNKLPDMRGLSENITELVKLSLNKDPGYRPGMFQVREYIERERSAKTTFSL